MTTGPSVSAAFTPLYFTDDYLAAAKVAALPLESADVAAIVAVAKQLTTAAHLLLPDEDVLLERCVVALLSGHVVLQGPPGTGKTTLAHILAEAFDATVSLETATADWSTYDVLGGLHPTAKHGFETLEPWLGHIPRAALDCASVIARHDDPDENMPQQAHWLILDEFNRAEIDKAIGPLYTVLGGGGAAAPVPLWFESDPQREAFWMPRRFRIVGTMNTVDTNYVNSFSQGLARRFQFVYVGVPEKTQVPDELTRASTTAAEWYAEHYDPAGTFDVAAFVSDARVTTASALLQELLEAVRYDDPASDRPGWPLGSAQLVDVFKQITLRLDLAGTAPDALTPALDLALADRVVPQAANLTRKQAEAFETWLEGKPLPRSGAAARQLRAASSTGY
jgi:5-methylcytosine-specific restriction protein B